ncbi:MAG: RNA polymerase subunit sigma-54 [Gemmatimonadetes bacterium]|nr:RNA polymerase subunit sigma-54 [Gemmatimonadota bacterium]
MNCAALPDGLLESAIFGHERGAFTGAVARSIGIFERAKGGTLLLDEVTEMAPLLQTKLLRVLQEGEFERVGGQRTLIADVRVIAATNREPLQAVGEGKLREDLFYRLNVAPIPLPPLRDRIEDIPLLADHFLRVFGERHRRDTRALSPAAMRVLMTHPWPGNVRELENAIERAVIFGSGRTLVREDLPVEILDGHPRSESTSTAAPRLPIPLAMSEIEHLAAVQTLEYAGGNKTEAARILGISRDTLYQKLRKSRPRGKATTRG